MKILQRSLALFLSCSLLFAAAPGGVAYAHPNEPPTQSATGAVRQTPEELQQLLAPIALYPDALVSQILAGATYPTEIVEADRWMQGHPNLKGKDLGKEVNKQSWDPSVKALTQFPSVLADMDKNLSWTSSLGEAYVNQPNDVMDAVQVMRARAKNAGNLKSNQQEKVQTQGQNIIIEPVDPEVVYLPAYDPWLVFGAPVAMWPGWYAYPGLYIAGPGISFGVGFGIGFFGGFGWGWHNWDCDWAHRTVIYNHRTYISHSATFANRSNFRRTTNNFHRTSNNFHHNTNSTSIHSAKRNMGLRAGLVAIRQLSAVLTMAASREAFPPVGAQASGEDFTAADFMEEVAGDSSFERTLQQNIWSDNHGYNEHKSRKSATLLVLLAATDDCRRTLVDTDGLGTDSRCAGTCATELCVCRTSEPGTLPGGSKWQ